MNKELLISALRLGKNGSEIINILDTICDTNREDVSVMQTVEVLSETISQGVSYNEPTLEPIEFWLVCATSFSGT